MQSREPGSVRDTTPTLPRADQAVPRRTRSRLAEFALSGFGRRLARVMDLWSSEAAREEGYELPQVRAWCGEALAKQGKMAGFMAIARVADAYMRMEAGERDAFFRMLRDEFGPDAEAIRAAYAAWEQDGAEGAGLIRLAEAMESPRLHLFRMMNTIPAGVKFLVDLRADVMARERAEPSLAPISHDLRHLLESWFNHGFLRLERITWDSPAALLERLVDYEAVHRIHHWRDLKHRLVSDRACFAFLHQAMPNEPVIFVEVALVNGLADSIQHILDHRAPDVAPQQADTAIFYGISNAQQGLRGIPFGNVLIKQVAARLRSEYPNLRTFATLSPLPRFRERFLLPALEDGSVERFFKKDEAERMRKLAGSETLGEAVRHLLDTPRWHENAKVAEALRPGLMRAARHYLVHERYNEHAACPVAHFHGSNGAVLARINWLGDTSPKGMRQSCGIMANYRYDMERFEKHQSAYHETGQIDTEKPVRDL